MGIERPALLLLLLPAMLPFLVLRRRGRHVPELALPADAPVQPPSWRVRLLWLPNALAATAVSGTCPQWASLGRMRAGSCRSR